MARPVGDGVGFPLRTRARVGAHVVWDFLSRPMAVEPDDVPWSAEAVSPAWLTAVLCKDHPGAEVVAVEVAEASSGSSVRNWIRAIYNPAGQAAGLPEHFFCKATPTVLTRLSSATVAANEAGFFRQIRKDLPIEAPPHYVSVFDANSGRSFHLFGDLVKTRDAVFCRFNTPISRDQVEQQVDLLAQFHARFHDSRRFEADLAWLPQFPEFIVTTAKGGTRVGHERAAIEAAHVIPPDVLARWDETWPAAFASFQTHADNPRTLLHSDVHLGNWYVNGDGRMGLCDWQLVCTGHWSRDFAYAVATSLEIEDRRAWERDLLARSIGRMAEIGGVEIAFDAAWTHYRQQMFAALLMWTPTLCHPPTMPDMQPEEMSLQMIRRITAAISDLESLDSF